MHEPGNHDNGASDVWALTAYSLRYLSWPFASPILYYTLFALSSVNCNHTLLDDNHLQGWAEKFIGWLWWKGRIWPNVIFFLKHRLPCGPHTSSTAVAAVGWIPCGSSNPDPRKKLLNCRYDIIIGPILLPSILDVIHHHVGKTLNVS